MAIEYDYITSTPDERTAIDAVNEIRDNVENTKLTAPPEARQPIAAFESWYGALEEKQSHWSVPGVLKSYRVNQADVNEAKRLLYAVKQATGSVSPSDEAPPAVVPPEQKPKDPIEAAGDAVKSGLTIAGLGIGAYILYKILS